MNLTIILAFSSTVGSVDDQWRSSSDNNSRGSTYPDQAAGRKRGRGGHGDGEGHDQSHIMEAVASSRSLKIWKKLIWIWRSIIDPE